MRKSFALILAILIMFFLATLLGVAFLRSNIQLREIEIRRASLYAFYAAESAIERAVFELRRDRNWRNGFGDENHPVSLTLADGTVVGFYWIDADGADDTSGTPDDEIQDGGAFGTWPQTLWVTAHGQDATRKITRIIRARIATQSPAEYFVSTPRDLVIGGGANITDSDLLGRNVVFQPTAPININGGKVYYIFNIDNEDDANVHVDADKDGVEEETPDDIQQVPPITFPSLDLSWYKSLFDFDGDGNPEEFYDLDGDGTSEPTGYYSSSQTISGTIDHDLPNYQGLIFVDGDAHISGNVTQSMHIVASGNIYIEGDITCSGTAQIGLSAKKDVIIPYSAGNPDIKIEAYIFADGGRFIAEKGINPKGTLTFKGAITVRGKEGESTSVALNIYPHRNYRYDSDLSSNLTIPFISFIANIIEWEEIK